MTALPDSRNLFLVSSFVGSAVRTISLSSCHIMSLSIGGYPVCAKWLRAYLKNPHPTLSLAKGEGLMG